MGGSAPRPRAKAAGAPHWLEVLAAAFRVVWKVFPKCTVVPALVLCAVVHSGASGPITQVARMLSAAADVVEGGSKATLSGLAATSDFSAEVATWSRSALSSGQSMYQSFMDGIDIINVSVERRRSRVVTSSGGLFATWVRNEGAEHTLGMGKEGREHLASIAESVSLWMPIVESEKTLYTPASYFGSVTVRAAYLPSGHVEVRWDYVSAYYDLLWANPVWEACGYEPETSSEVIAIAIGAIVSSIPSASHFNASDEILVLPMTTVMMATVRRWVAGFAFALAGAPPSLN